ncbi:TPA: hypothetical protein DCG86_07295 [Candidatus Marinimicrobia bacterium]|nr:MAG: Glycoside hydrolase family 2 sugar binding protein [Marinimicrobia bacterium 46_47]HAE87813.1 hypothetical protein [Candidatus Neomarinimicrobiota bacterium]HBY18833.1 hypothetical protein [Candidatus Neomarinimicrobiota bacterium]
MNPVLIEKKITEKNFKNPPLEMGILPFWFWNGEMTESEMEWQLKEYKSRKIPGLFIHGRFGLKVPYLSPEWFERVKFAVKKGKEIGLDIWIYDEMNWPSGSAERQVIKKYPYLGQKYLEMVTLHITGPLFIYLEATDTRYVNTGDSKPIAAYACSLDEYENEIKDIIDLTPQLSFNKIVPWEAPAGKWVLMYFLEKEIDYYIDALNPESTQRFIELTHERYKNAVGEEFGNVVPGFYTDEPAMHYFQVGTDNFIVPWSSQMFKIFRERNGYSLKPYLPALYANMGKKTTKIRYDFWRALSDQYDEHYYGALRKWCEANHVLFTGHILFENWLRGHARCEGNVIKHLKNMHLTGVDHLYPKIGSADEPGEHVEIKMASSAAHHFGSKRLLCESMGGTHWDCSLERMKWIANWEYSLGVNLFNNHGYHYSIEGERKRDWPPSQFYHHTWWKYYDQFTTYMARLGLVLTGGRHVAKILVLYPINSIWTNYIPQYRNQISELIESDFNYLTDALLRLHYDFDYVDEEVLAEATINHGKIHIADESYSMMILPPVTHIKKSSLDMMKHFVQQGGKVLANNLLPVEILEANDSGDVRSVQDIFGVDPHQLLEDFEKGTNPDKIQALDNNVMLIRGTGLEKGRQDDDLKAALEKCLTPDVRISHPHVFYLHRIKDDQHIYFLVNTLQKDIGEVTVDLEVSGIPELWNPDMGKAVPLHVYNIIEGRLQFKLNFAACETSFVIIREGDIPTHITDSNLVIEKADTRCVSGFLQDERRDPYVVLNQCGKENKYQVKQKKALNPIQFPEEMMFELEGNNTLLVKQWKMKVVSSEDSDKEYFQPDFYDQDWLTVTPGSWELQLPYERDEESFPQTVWYRAQFLINDMPSRTSLLIDGFSGSSYKLYINGKRVTDPGKRSTLDAEIKEVNIHSFVKPGENLIAVQLVVQRRTDGLLDMLKIIGNFALDKQEGQYVIAAPNKEIRVGDWCPQGYPYYSGTGIYSVSVNIPETYCQGKLFLNVECGEDVLEVQVNQHEPIILPWHPYHVDITDLVKPGKNYFNLKVTNTLINVLEAVQKPSGVFKPPAILHFNTYEITVGNE